MKKIITMIICAALILALALPALAAATPSDLTPYPGMQNFAALVRGAGKAPAFSDVNAAEWYGDKNEAVVSKAAAYGLMVGDNGLFDPNGSVTLLQAITMAARLSSIYETGKAEFVEGEPWYQVYVDYCTEKGVLKAANIGASQDMNAAATREQYGRLMVAALPSAAYEVKNTIDYGAIPDVPVEGAGGDYAYTLYRAGIVEGKDGGKFCPRDGISRAESAALVVRIVDVSQRRSFTLTKDSGGESAKALTATVLLSRQAVDAAKTGLADAYLKFTGSVSPAVAVDYTASYSSLMEASEAAQLCLTNIQSALESATGDAKEQLSNAGLHLTEAMKSLEALRSGVASLVLSGSDAAVSAACAKHFDNAATYLGNTELFLARAYEGLTR